MLIPTDEITWHGSSYADPSGRLFHWRGRLLRGVPSDQSRGLADFIRSGKAHGLAERGFLVPTHVTDLQTERYDLVVEHDEYRPVSYPFEWCASMLYEAANLILELQRELDLLGYHLKDSHPWNVVFDGPKPVFVDLGSIEVGRTRRWAATAQFRQFVLNPLQLYAAGHVQIANNLLRDFLHGVPDQVARSLGARLPRSILNRCVDVCVDHLSRRRVTALALALARRVREWTALSRRSDVERLERALGRIDIGRPATRWSAYYDDDFPRFDDRADWSEKHGSFAAALEAVAPSSLLDVAGNRGWYAQYAASSGVRVTAFDYDESAVRLLFADVRDQDLPVLPIFMDVQRPSPAEGLGFSYMPTSVDRFQAEMVIALAICHHVCYFQNVPLDALIHECASYAQEALMFEFIEPNDAHVREWGREQPFGYSLEHAMAALNALFSEVASLPSNLPTRHLLLCRGLRVKESPPIGVLRGSDDGT